MTETIPAMRARWKSELVAAIKAQARRNITQTEAAPILGVSVQRLNALIHNNEIHWPCNRQAAPTNTRETAQ
jgi:hypothetical protein